MPEKCPHCGVSLQAEPIPAEYLGYYGGATHFNRAIGIVYQDRVQRWRCPDCNGEWNRDSDPVPNGIRTCNVEFER